MTHFSPLWSLLAALPVAVSASHADAQSADGPRREARVVFETNPQHLAIYKSAYRSTGWASAGIHTANGETHDFQRVCVAPCEATLPAGTDTYSVTRLNGVKEGEPKPVGAITVPSGYSTVRVDYRDYAAIRFVGQFLGCGVALGGLVYGLLESSRHRQCSDEACKRSHRNGMLLGGGLLLGGITLGVVVGGIDDGVDVKVTPRAASAPARQVALRGTF